MRSPPFAYPAPSTAQRPPDAQQPATDAYRSPRLSEIWMRITAVIGILLLLAISVWVHRRVHRDAAARAAVAAGVNQDTVAALVARAEKCGGPTAAGALRWQREMTTGAQQTEAFLLRVFTGTSYLMADHNDRAFARDLYEVLLAEQAGQDWLDQVEVFFAKGGSRLSLLQAMPSVPAIDTPEGSVRTFSITKRFPRVDQVTIGTAIATGQCRLDHVQARLMLYVDGSLRADSWIHTADPTFEVRWDTRAETPGDHEVAVLLRSSDGRGRIVEQDRFTVPQVVALADGSAYATQLVEQEQWYHLTPASRDVWFNANLPDGDLALQLFDLEGQLLLRTDNRGTGHETLRYRGESERVYYARVRRGAAQNNMETVAYTVTTSDRSARLLRTDEIFAVDTLDEEGRSLLAVDHAGQTHHLAYTDVELIHYTGRLSALEILLPDGSPAGLYPDFARETTTYGLYVPAAWSLDREALQYEIQAQEGDAATLTVVHSREGGFNEHIAPTGPLSLARSENQLTIDVTGYDGSHSTYTVYILYSPHTGGYDVETLHAFPASYRAGLWLLHQQHPSYIYEPFDTKIDWAHFIDVQDETDRSLIQAGQVPDSWVEAGSPVYDGTVWKAAARPVIEHYADPRNFLHQATLFQFERLDFNTDVQTQDGIRAILHGTFMAARLDFYADLFMRAGEHAGISPYFLASRAVQEMGAQGESPLAHGTLPGYEGYYNYFNIGSYPNPEVPDGQRINGALFAMYGHDPEQKQITPDEEAVWLPWDSIEKSIIGGAIFIAERYVAAGQNTLYFQKFDVIPENGLYMRQYAQNIQMAWAEGLRSFTGYRAIGLEQGAFVFRIPFYRQMPIAPVPLPER